MINTPTLVAHRGYSARAPENTLAAYDLALDSGFPHIELDVQLSRDKVPVAFHDGVLDRTTNGSGPLADKTFAELRKLDAGSWFSEEFEEEKIPSLEEIVDRYVGRAILHLEEKSREDILPDIIRRTLFGTGWLPDHSDKIIISSFSKRILDKSVDTIGKIDDIAHELLVVKVKEDDMVWAAEHGIKSYHPDGNLVDPQLIKRASELGLSVGAWWWSTKEQRLYPEKHTGLTCAFVDDPLSHLELR